MSETRKFAATLAAGRLTSASRVRDVLLTLDQDLLW